MFGFHRGIIVADFFFAAGFALKILESDACHGSSVWIRWFDCLGSRRNSLGLIHAVVVLRGGSLGYSSWRLGWLRD